jgi:hypothetical protein
MDDAAVVDWKVRRMEYGKLTFKIVRVETAGQELLARGQSFGGSGSIRHIGVALAGVVDRAAPARACDSKDK